MRLTRRDAIVAAAVGGVVGVAGFAASERPEVRDGRTELTPDDVDTLLALAEIVYPSEVTGSSEFVETYAAELHVTRRRGITSTIDALDRAVGVRHGERFAELEPGQRESVLEHLGVHRVHAAADGSLPERVRSYLVNGLLYALFTSPAGTKLVGLNNPLGYPGGYESALRGEP